MSASNILRIPPYIIKSTFEKRLYIHAFDYFLSTLPRFSSSSKCKNMLQPLRESDFGTFLLGKLVFSERIPFRGSMQGGCLISQRAYAAAIHTGTNIVTENSYYWQDNLIYTSLYSVYRVSCA